MQAIITKLSTPYVGKSIIVFLALGVLSYNISKTYAQTFISGRVILENGTPIKDVTIIIDGGRPVFTTMIGTFGIEIKGTKPTEVKAIKKNLKMKEDWVYDEKEKKLKIVMVPLGTNGGSIEGRIYDAQNKPLTNAMIILSKINPTMPALTNSRGEFSIKILEGADENQLGDLFVNGTKFPEGSFSFDGGNLKIDGRAINRTEEIKAEVKPLETKRVNKIRVLDVGGNVIQRQKIRVDKKDYITDSNGELIVNHELNKDTRLFIEGFKITILPTEEYLLVKVEMMQNTEKQIGQKYTSEQTQQGLEMEKQASEQIWQELDIEKARILKESNEMQQKIELLTKPLRENIAIDESQKQNIKINLSRIKEKLIENEQVYENMQERNRLLINRLSLLIAEKDSIAKINFLAVKKLDSLAIAKEKAERERIFEQEESQKRQIIIALVAFFFSALALVLFIFGRKAQKRKNELALKNEELVGKNEEIQEKSAKINEVNEELHQTNEELKTTLDVVNTQAHELQTKNADITASINAAKLIQDAILPSEKAIANAVSDFFIFYQPRDIVSGDFYYYTQKNGKFIITAVDCTGHGIPGAFMSMLSNQVLNEVIEQKNITEANKILHELNIIIGQSLHTEETTSHAGMDLALCVIDKKNKLLEYAGAMNPLYYVQHGEFKEIKADKQAIGGMENKLDKTFTPHYISLDSPTIFYLCSDGFQDQFGGEQGKKFMVKKTQRIAFFYSSLVNERTKRNISKHA